MACRRVIIFGIPMWLMVAILIVLLKKLFSYVDLSQKDNLQFQTALYFIVVFIFLFYFWISFSFCFNNWIIKKTFWLHLGNSIWINFFCHFIYVVYVGGHLVVKLCSVIFDPFCFGHYMRGWSVLVSRRRCLYWNLCILCLIVILSLPTTTEK